jgi:integrase
MGHTLLMRCKYYRRKDRKDRWVVYLDWQGEHYTRTRYDDREPLQTERLALRICEQVNGDIEACLKEKRRFDPRRWFKPKDAIFGFASYADKWLAKQKKYAPSVIKDIARHIEEAKKFFKLIPIYEINTGTVQDYLDQLPEHLAPKTKKNYLTTLHKLLSDARFRQDIPVVPPFPPIELSEPETKWMLEEDQDKVFENLPKHDLPIFWFMRTYGPRPAEARALMWDKVDLAKGVIVIKRGFSNGVLREFTKKRDIRYLPVVEPIGTILKTLREQALKAKVVEIGGIEKQIEKQFVFLNQAGNHYCDNIHKKWNRACQKAGVTHIKMYEGTRHSRATQLAIEGKSLKLIGDLLGHKDRRSTDRYAKVAMRGLKKLLGEEDE